MNNDRIPQLLAETGSQKSPPCSSLKNVTHMTQWENQLLPRLGRWSWDIPTGVLTWSDELYHIFGLDKEAFNPTHQAFLDLVHPDERALFEGALDDYLKGRRPYDCEFRIVGPDSTVRTLQSRGQAIFDETGKPLGMIGTMLDITERKREEERIRELVAIVESSDDAIFRKTLDGIITSWNKGAENIYGFAENEVIGQPISILFPSYRQDEAPQILGQIELGEVVSRDDTVRRRKESPTESSLEQAVGGMNPQIFSRL